MIDNELALLKESQLDLIIENFLGFVPEKLFDSILCGTIPIYFLAEFSG